MISSLKKSSSRNKTTSFIVQSDTQDTSRVKILEPQEGMCDCRCKRCDREINLLKQRIDELNKVNLSLERKIYQMLRIEQFREMRFEKREQLLNHIAGRVKEETSRNEKLQTSLNKIKENQEQTQEFAYHILGGVEYRIKGRNHQENQISFHKSGKISTSRMTKLIGSDNTQRFINKSLSVIKNKVYRQDSDLRKDMETLDDLMLKNNQHSEKKLPLKINPNIQVPIIPPSASQTVSDNQGAESRKSFFSDELGRFSFFQIDEAQKLKVHDKLDFLLELLHDEDTYQQKLDQLNPLQQREVGACVFYAITDLQHFINIGWRLKSLVEVTTEMVRNTSLLSTFQAIMDLSCQYLKCDRLSIFMLDKTKKILWTKAASSLQMIEVPIDKGIVGYAVKNNTKINVTDAYRDERFNQEIDRQTGYKTKSILVVPINNEKGQTIGALQAINKEEGPFNFDDEAILSMIASYSGGIIKNSLLFEDAILKLERTKKLLKFSTRLYDTKDKLEVITLAQKQLEDMLGVQRCQFCLVKREKDHLILEKFNYKLGSNGEAKMRTSNQIVKECNSVITRVLLDGKAAFFQTPGQSDDYNPQQDIETTLSLITLPVRSSEDNQIIAIIQVEAIKGFVARALGTYKEDDLEILTMFSTIIGTFLSGSNTDKR